MRSAELAITSLISNKRELLNSFKKFEARNTSAKSKKIRAKSKIRTNLSRLNLMTFWKRNCKNIFQFFALDVTKMYRIFFSFCSMANLAKRCLRKVNFVLKQFALTTIGQRALFFFLSNLTFVNLFAIYNFVFHHLIDTAPQFAIA